jgi:hypothetical protein
MELPKSELTVGEEETVRELSREAAWALNCAAVAGDILAAAMSGAMSGV